MSGMERAQIESSDLIGDILDSPCPEAPLEFDEVYDITSADCKPNAIDGMCRVICEYLTDSSNETRTTAGSTPSNKFLIECDGKKVIDIAGKQKKLCGAVITRYALDGSAHTTRSAREIKQKLDEL